MEKSSRKPWTLEEDKCLADCLLETHLDNKIRGEGGFRNGCLGHMEKLMGQKLIGTDLKAIDSRLSYLKKQFFAIHEIREKATGFEWDDEKKMVTGDRLVYHERAKSHPAAKGLHMKPWPLYNIFEKVYAKDRATGTNAATAADRLQEKEQSSNILTESMTINDVEDNDISDQEGTTKKARQKRRLRKNDVESMQKQLVDLVEHVNQSNNDCVSKIINALKEDEKCDRNKLHGELNKIPGLSIIQ